MIKILNCNNKRYKQKLINFLAIRRSDENYNVKKVSKIIKDIKPKKIILISCSPENFAIDISRLIDDNIFNLSRVIPFDMFPQTRHVEVIGILDLVNE